MGMFSYLCKGCHGELCEGELVRLNGTRQEYDGYGGSLQGEDAPCWHEICYQRASSEQKLDPTPSKSAPNQGFGPAKLEFRRGFDPSKPVVDFEVAVFQGISNSPWYLTDQGLEHQEVWEKLVEEKTDGGELSGLYRDFDAAPDKDAAYTQFQEGLVKVIGYDSPERRSLKFPSLQQALEAVKPHLPSQYSIHVYAHQGKIEAAVCEFSRHERINWDGSDYEHTGEFVETTSYEFRSEN